MDKSTTTSEIRFIAQQLNLKNQSNVLSLINSLLSVQQVNKIQDNIKES